MYCRNEPDSGSEKSAPPAADAFPSIHPPAPMSRVVVSIHVVSSTYSGQSARSAAVAVGLEENIVDTLLSESLLVV